MSDRLKIPNNFERSSFALFLGLITLALLVIIWPFASAILWSVVAAIMFQPLYLRILSGSPSHANRAAMASLLIIFIAIIIPTLWIGSILVEQITSFYLSLQGGEINAAAIFGKFFDALPLQLRTMLNNSGFGEFRILQERLEQLIQESAGFVAQQAFSIGGSALSFILALGVGLYIMYFLLRDGQALAQNIKDSLPFEKSVAVRVSDRFIVIVRATIKGSVVVGMIQGALGALTFWIVGMPSAVLFGVLMAFFSLVPALGSAIIWLPVAAYLLITGDIWQAIVVVLSGVFIIGMADNILRPIMVGRDTGIPDWIILVTTLGGIATFGLSGIVLGPLAAGLCLAGWTIYREQRDQIAN